MADVHSQAQFYATAGGAVAARLIRERLAGFWPDVTGQNVLGIGYPLPYLRLWREPAARCIAVIPAQTGIARWPAGAPNLTCTAEEDALPLPDLSFDRVLLVHGLETAENARRLLREIWRVLKDDGRLLIVAPNRRGPWAYLESTPFGHGQPYSSGQLGRLLAASLFRVERRDAALHLPPSRRRIALRGAMLLERPARRFAPALAGVTITEAVKDVYAALPLRPAPRRRLVLAEAA
ncbi:MAG: class I SAM-dependent methyltransferase [Rhodospirillales bacterium]|nr:class I SAM-dependent methyltransferase [Rhodospirillales bacterium]